MEALTAILERLSLDNKTRRLRPPNPNPNSNLGPLHRTSFKKTKTEAERKGRRAQTKTKVEKPDNRGIGKQLWLLLQRLDLPFRPQKTKEEKEEWRAQRKKDGPEEKERDRQLRLLLLQTPSESLNPAIEWLATTDERAKIDGDDAESEIFGFYSRLFIGNEDLKMRYKKGSKLRCLVCGVKNYRDCVALIRHCTYKTRMIAHRAFGRSLCWVLGWRFTRLEFINLENSVVQSMTKAMLKDGCKEDDDLDQKNAESVGTDNMEMMDCGVMITLH